MLRLKRIKPNFQPKNEPSMKKIICRISVSFLLFCSIAAFAYMNLGSSLPTALHQITAGGDSTEARVVLPDVAIFSAIWKTGKNLVPAIIFTL